MQVSASTWASAQVSLLLYFSTLNSTTTLSIQHQNVFSSLPHPWTGSRPGRGLLQQQQAYQRRQFQPCFSLQCEFDGSKHGVGSINVHWGASSRAAAPW